MDLHDSYMTCIRLDCIGSWKLTLLYYMLCMCMFRNHLMTQEELYPQSVSQGNRTLIIVLSDLATSTWHPLQLSPL